jgi:hypothetical protein
MDVGRVMFFGQAMELVIALYSLQRLFKQLPLLIVLLIGVEVFPCEIARLALRPQFRTFHFP